MESYKCDVCAKSFTGLVCFQQHEASEKHKKKVRMASGAAAFEMSKSINPDQFQCPVCIISISGWDNYQKHVISLDHALNVQKKNGDLLSQSLSGTFQLKTEQNQLMESTVSMTNPVKVVAPFAECKPCQKQFSGPEPYQQHLVSAGHKKKCGSLNEIMQSNETDFSIKVEMNNSLYDPQSSVSKGDLNTIVPQPFAKCDICKMEFNGAVLYQMHLLSDGHKEQAGNQLLGNSFAESQNALKCDICVMSFSGPVPYQQHLVSNGHKKKINAAELSKQLATGSLPPPDSTCRENYLGIGQTSDIRMWYCDTCNKQCSGPIPYNTHILSRDHLKNLRILEVNENLKKIKESGPFAQFENDKIDSSLSSQVTSTADLHSEFKNESKMSSDKFKINDLNIDFKREDTKILADKFEINANDLIALPNLNIIPPEKLDVSVFGPDDEIIFSSPKKSKQGFLSEINEVKKMNKKFNESNCLMVEY